MKTKGEPMCKRIFIKASFLTVWVSMSMETRTVKLLKALLNALPQVMPEACWCAQGGKVEDLKKTSDRIKYYSPQ